MKKIALLFITSFIYSAIINISADYQTIGEALDYIEGGDNHSSDVYFVRMISGGFISAKKLMLVN